MKCAFGHGETVYLKIDRSEWVITHIIVDLYGTITYRISNGYASSDVWEVELTDDPNIAKTITGFKK
jgi:hypothetical protein